MSEVLAQLDRFIAGLRESIDALDALTTVNPNGVNQSSRRVLMAFLDDAIATRDKAPAGVEWGGR